MAFEIHAKNGFIRNLGTISYINNLLKKFVGWCFKLSVTRLIANRILVSDLVREGHFNFNSM